MAKRLTLGMSYPAMILGLLCTAPSANATLVVVPSSASASEGNSTSVVPLNTGARTNQYQMTNAAMGGLPIGVSITGVQFRLDGTQAAGPSAAITWSDYEITLAKATNSIGGMSATLASNMNSPVLVKDGAFTLTAGSLPGTGSPRAFGGTIVFDTPYLYSGGDLVMLLTHTNGTGGATPTVDGIQTDALGTGGIRALSTAIAFQATTADNTAFRIPVMQFTYTVASIPEPNGWLLMGVLSAAIFFAKTTRREAILA